jgi:hypothetical protein
MTHVLVGTIDGLHRIGSGSAPEHGGREVTALGAEYPNVWAVLDGSEIWRTGDEGWMHRGTLDGLHGNCIADTRAGYLVGTSEAHVFRVADSGLERVDSFEVTTGRDGWYTPWGGPPDARSITEDAAAVYVNVHVGGIVRTRDEGATWEPTIDVDADVHKVWSLDGRVYAACARGLAVSDDDGDTWAYRTDGLHADYCRGVALCGDAVLVSASTGPRGGRSAVYRGARDGGGFERCTVGLPDWFDANVDSSWLDAIPNEGVAVFGTGDGKIFVSTDEGTAWSEAASGLPSIRCVLVMP